MGEVQKHIIRRGKRSVLSTPFHKKNNDGAFAAWKLDLDRIRRVFEVHFFPPFLKIANYLLADRVRERKCPLYPS